MSGRVGHRKRLICVTAADLRSARLDLAGHADFFPPDCFGEPGAKGKAGALLTLDVEGLAEPVQTDIPTAPDGGKERHAFRLREWVREFFQKHSIKPGDTISIERLNSHHFRISPFEAKEQRDCPVAFAASHKPQDEGLRVIELFAGCGGMALGFKNAGFQTVLANEWDADACKTLRANITDRVLNCAIQEIQKFPKADVVAGGPPCQGFSNLGERVPNDPRNQLWRHYFRCVEQARPRFFVLENVPPLLASAEFIEMVKLSTKLGYKVEGRVLNTADYGVPQTRKRAIVIGSRVGEPRFPEPTHADPQKRSSFTPSLLPWRTVRNAIGHLPLDPTGEGWHIGRNPSPKSLERYRCIPPGGNRWNLPPHLMPECWKRKTKGGTDLFGRLWWDRPSVTIRTEFYKPEKGRYLHPSADRPITHLEAALLQSFPGDFNFCGTRINVGIQIGNAVPPLFAQAIAAELAAALGACVKPALRHSG